MTAKLEKLVRIYSVDTSAFYNDNEIKIHKKLLKLYRHRDVLKKGFLIKNIRIMKKDINTIKNT